MDITLNNGRAFGDQIGPKTGEITEFTCIEDFINAFEKQMEFFVRNMVEADNCIDTAHGDLVPLPFESGLIEGCIEKGKSVQEGGAIWNFSGPQGVGIIDAGDCLYSIQKNVFEDHKFTLAELKEALENNFGYPIPAIGSQPISAAAGDPKYSVGNMSLESMNLVNEPKAGGAGAVADCVAGRYNNTEDQIYAAVKALLSGGSVDNLGELLKTAAAMHARARARARAAASSRSFRMPLGRDADDHAQYARFRQRYRRDRQVCSALRRNLLRAGGEVHERARRQVPGRYVSCFRERAVW